jgi:NaMN:DMB phosphoribosyltransferase
MNLPFVRTINDPFNQYERLVRLLSKSKGVFSFCVASTETSDVEGISAAGATAASRRLTPSIDADVLVFGHPRDGELIPVSPIGVVSPVVIALSCLKLMKVEPLIIDCGTFRSPLKSNMTAGTLVAKSVSTGRALPLANVRQLFEAGRRFACEQLTGKPDYLVFSECVPGGTTTALAVLKSLGVEADSLVSSSLPAANGLRTKVVEKGFAALKRYSDATSKDDDARNADDAENANTNNTNNTNNTIFEEQDPLLALAAFGDPMQPFVAGAALYAANHIPVILGGGSQMVAVYHLCDRLSSFLNIPFNRENIFVITTKWISDDANSNTRRLSQLLGAPFFSAAPDFRLSRFAGLQAYEEGHVKEGVGAGALMAAAALHGQLSREELMDAIDACYEETVLGVASKFGKSEMPFQYSVQT